MRGKATTAQISLRFDLDYALAEVTGTFGRYGLTLGNEVLQGDGTTGFATPLATLHASMAGPTNS